MSSFAPTPYSELHVDFLDLDPHGNPFFNRVGNLGKANGILFRCPACTKQGNSGHHVICWNPSVPQHVPPRPGRWNLRGTGVQDLTLEAGSSSIQLQTSCNAHFYIREGMVTPA